MLTALLVSTMTKRILLIIVFILSTLSCKTTKVSDSQDFKATYTLAFGSCNRHDLPNLLWDDVLRADPDLWAWGGDIIYADTSDMEKLRAFYNAQNQVVGYKKLKKAIPVVGTWDDHDYGLNDGGADFGERAASQVEFLNFIGAPDDDSRRFREGIYTVHNLVGGAIKLIVLDTRYFRTPLTPDTDSDKRYKPSSGGTILGEEQWKWLENELSNSNATFNVILSSIQIFSSEHGFETWGNFPDEQKKLFDLFVRTKPEGLILLSGDRHISEFSRMDIDGLSYPLIDFTSSGLTHAYTSFTSEENPYRVGFVVSTPSFGLLKFNLAEKKVRMSIRGDNGVVISALEQDY